MYMGIDQASKVESLDNVLANLESLVASGRNELNNQIAEASEGYRVRK